MAQSPKGSLYGPLYKRHLGVCAIYSQSTVYIYIYVCMCIYVWHPSSTLLDAKMPSAWMASTWLGWATGESMVSSWDFGANWSSFLERAPRVGVIRMCSVHQAITFLFNVYLIYFDLLVCVASCLPSRLKKRTLHIQLHEVRDFDRPPATPRTGRDKSCVRCTCHSWNRLEPAHIQRPRSKVPGVLKVSQTAKTDFSASNATESLVDLLWSFFV